MEKFKLALAAAAIAAGYLLASDAEAAPTTEVPTISAKELQRRVKAACKLPVNAEATPCKAIAAKAEKARARRVAKLEGELAQLKEEGK